MSSVCAAEAVRYLTMLKTVRLCRETVESPCGTGGCVFSRVAMCAIEWADITK